MEFALTAEEQPGERLDRFLQGRCPDLSRSRLQDLIREGHVRLNDMPAKPSVVVRHGDRVQMVIPELRPVKVEAQDIPMEVLYQDSDIIVINKAAGLVVHPAAGNPDGTLVNALLHHVEDLSGIGGEMRPGIVHRLDKDTSGCLVIAKNDIAHRRLTEAFSERRISKIYLAAVSGVPKTTSGRIQNFIGRHPVDRKRMSILLDGAGREAITEWEVAGEHQGCALIRCKLLTGRTHQIRVHMKEALGCPILGDPIYGHPNRQKIPTSRLMLHAWLLSFQHPIHNRPLSFEAPVPAEFALWLTPKDGVSG